MGSISTTWPGLETISRMLRERPLPVLREMLPDRAILDACAGAHYTFRERLYDPVVTVFHFLIQAIQREHSFAATWAELWGPVAVAFGLPDRRFNSSALSQARSRLPQKVVEVLARGACAVHDAPCERWHGMRLEALDGTTVSMPREALLFDHFGAHHARTTTVRYPLGTFCCLLRVGSSLIEDYRFGPFDCGEKDTATPLVAHLRPGDLLLADRGFAGSPTMARVLARGSHFLMRKNARLIVSRLPVLKRLGPHDFITELTVNPIARAADPSLPARLRVRLFRATWLSPAGERLTDWFVTSLRRRRRFPPQVLANLYHRRWRIETSYLEFKVLFHTDVLRSKTVSNIYKELAAHVLAYQLVRRLIRQAAVQHQKSPTEISFLHATRWILSFSSRMSLAASERLPAMYGRLLDAIASTEVDVRPGRLEPRALTREWKHYPHLRMSRSQWRTHRLKEATTCLS